MIRIWHRGTPHYPGRTGGPGRARPARGVRSVPPPRSGGKPPTKANACLTVVALAPLFLLYALAAAAVRRTRSR